MLGPAEMEVPALVSLDISEVLPTFPEFRVALVVARDLDPEAPDAPASASLGWGWPRC